MACKLMMMPMLDYDKQSWTFSRIFILVLFTISWLFSQSEFGKYFLSNFDWLISVTYQLTLEELEIVFRKYKSFPILYQWLYKEVTIRWSLVPLLKCTVTALFEVFRNSSPTEVKKAYYQLAKGIIRTEIPMIQKQKPSSKTLPKLVKFWATTKSD